MNSNQTSLIPFFLFTTTPLVCYPLPFPHPPNRSKEMAELPEGCDDDQIKSRRWCSYSDFAEECVTGRDGVLTTDQQEELEALVCVYGNDQLQFRLGHEAGMVQLQLYDVYLERHRCKATISLSLPPAYPNAPPVLAVHSAHISKKLLNTVESEVMEYFVEGEPAGHMLMAEAEHALTRLEKGAVALHFVYCPTCSAKEVKAGKAKQPQPASPDLKTCLECCGTVVVPLRSAAVNADQDLCDFCFCEDSPFLKLSCGDSVCVECFQRWAAIDVGAKKLVKDKTTKQYSIACPTHLTETLRDTALMKLAAPRTFNLYTRFAFDLAVENASAVTCPLPGCTNYPFLPGSRHNLLHCPYCHFWFCNVCHSSVVACTCEGRRVHSEIPHPWPFVRSTPSDPTCRVPEHEALETADRVPIRVKYHSGWLDLRLEPEHTAEYLMQLLGGEVYHDVYFRVHRVNPWGKVSKDWPVVPGGMVTLLFNGRLLDPADKLDFIYPGAQLYAVLYYPPTATYVTELLDEIDLMEFRRGLTPSAALQDTAAESKTKKRSDFVGKKCPHCTKPVVHYYRHGCHHIGFAGEGCCDKHWCYVCKGPHPCRTCPVICDTTRSCKCPLCPDCKMGSPCPTCTGCPRCTPFMANGDFDLFD